MRAALENLIAAGETIIADGGMGTMLFSLGLEQGDSPELWNVEQPEKVRSVHRAYIEAGAQIILTNTFGCNRLRLGLHDLSDLAARLNKAAAKLARAEADAADHPVVVGGDIGPTGGLLKPVGDLEYEEVVAAFEEQAGALAEGGVDVLWVETMSALEEVQAAVEACRRVAPDFPIVTTMTFDTNGFTMMGVSPEKALRAMQNLGVIALGANCGNGPDEIIGVIEKMHALSPAVPLIAKANAGIPHLENGIPVYDATPEMMAGYAVEVRNLGARIIGACCGSTPEHIRQMKAALDRES
jgi:methionine synthase I (cobalamin-dependent)